MNAQTKRAMTFVALIGVVSLFADVTDEGARSVNDRYLAILGAGSLAVGIVAGVGELLGYLLRPLSGALADRTARYWTITIIGYIVNLFAVPALALAGQGWIFGFHEAMDQLRATVGPLIVALVLALRGRYSDAYALPLIPAILAVAVVVVGRFVYALEPCRHATFARPTVADVPPLEIH